MYGKLSRILPLTSRYIQDADSFKSLELFLQLGRELVWRYDTHWWFLWSCVLIDKESFDSTIFPDGQFEEFIDIIQGLPSHQNLVSCSRSSGNNMVDAKKMVGI